ncbi:MAG TPA: hypothetical protein VFJ98_02195 [Mycobacteriales bacterium]|nr:hypothetical protein [Mycobacteriales bacterium]
MPDRTVQVRIDGTDLAEVRRRLAIAGSAGGRHVCPVLDAATDGRSVVVTCAVGSGLTLHALAARRGRLSPGEVVTVVVGLATALAALHERGLALGAVSAESIGFAVDGAPMLVPAPLVERAADAVASDVAALASVAASLLDPDASTPGLRAVLAQATGGAVAATSLAAAVRAAASPAPVAFDGVAAPGRRRHARPAGAAAARTRADRSRQVPERLRPALAVVVVAGLAVAVGSALGRHTGGDALAARPVPLPTHVAGDTRQPARVGWRTVMARLEAARARAFLDGDDALLAEVYAPAARIGWRDRGMLHTLTRHGEHVTGLRTFVEHVTVVSAARDTATLLVTDALTSYDVLDRRGRVQRHGTGRPSRSWRVTLTRTPAGWRIWSVADPDQSPRRS